MNILDFFILALATYRLSRFVATEEGPFSFMEKIRWLCGVQYDEASNPYATNGFAELLICMYCNSFWIGALMLVIWLYVSPLIVYPFSLSAVVVLFLEINEYG